MAVPSAPAAARVASPYLLLTLTPFFWACNWIVGRGLHSEIPPMAMTFYRWFFALLILAPFALPHVRRDRGIVRRNWRVLAILSGGNPETLASLTLNRGDLLIILALLLWSVYTIGLRWRPAGLHMLTFLFVIACIGDAAVLPLYLSEMALGARMTFSWLNLAALFFVALFSSVLAYIFWNRGVEQVGASVAGLFVHLMPVFGTILAWLLLDERLRLFHVVGIALILTGIYVTSRAATPPIPAAPE